METRPLTRLYVATPAQPVRATKQGSQRHGLRWPDRLFQIGTALAGIGIALLVLAMGTMLALGGRLALSKFGLDFLTESAWDPVRGQFGALPALVGTCVSAGLALAIAVPVAIGIAIFLTELAPAWLSGPASLAVEMMAAVPSIIYGMWGLFVLAPALSERVEPFLGRTLGFLPFFQGPPMGIGMLAAALVLSLMVIPYIAAVARDLFRMVPPQVKEAAYGLGATRWEVMRAVVLPHTRLGLVGAVILGLGRALGETMAVTFVIGNSHKISASLFAASGTIASTLANEFAEATDTLHMSALMALALVLFLLTFAVLALGRLLVRLGSPA
jgi:phosphate transport system permease protein